MSVSVSFFNLEPYEPQLKHIKSSNTTANFEHLSLPPFPASSQIGCFFKNYKNGKIRHQNLLELCDSQRVTLIQKMTHHFSWMVLIRI